MTPHPLPAGVPPVLCIARRRLTLLLLCLLLALLPPGTARAEGARWQWPTPPPHPVARPFEAPAHAYAPGHRGIDIAVPGPGTPVRAVEAGTVRFAGSVAGRGVVSVTHADGLVSTYEPVAGSVRAGQAVAAGEVLGTVAEGGPRPHCAAACLHLGARVGDRYLDPLLLLGARGPSVLLPWDGAGAVPGPALVASSPPGPVDGPADGSGVGSGAGSGAGSEKAPARSGRQAVLAH